MKKLTLSICLILCLGATKFLAEDRLEVGIEYDKKLGQFVDLNLSFTDSDGSIKKLKDIIKKPTVLSLVYYHCPGICSPLLTNLGKVIDQAQVEPGKDYQVLTISFDPKEDAPLAAKWKNNYLKSLKRPVKSEDWSFMVGDSLNIAKITDQVGFRYKSDGKDDYIHSGALIVLGTDGKIDRYLLGTDYLPFDFKMAVYETAKGIAAPPISRMLAYCYSYDPNGRTYVFNFTKVAGTIIFVGAGVLLLTLILKGRSKNSNNGGLNV
ncbi:MAG TPA: SCO family protein [Candidatus Kapabacteria bacterium]|nr:SCO family protein [Candidatus Kapabacteria bacterium]